MNNGIIRIDRSKLFDPAHLFGGGEGTEYGQDEQSLIITELDFRDVELLMPNPDLDGEDFTAGQRRLERLKEAGYIRLDATIGNAIYQDRHLIPPGWEEQAKAVPFSVISFAGTTWTGPNDSNVFALRWRNGHLVRCCSNLSYADLWAVIRVK